MQCQVNAIFLLNHCTAFLGLIILAPSILYGYVTVKYFFEVQKVLPFNYVHSSSFLTPEGLPKETLHSNSDFAGKSERSLDLPSSVLLI